MADLIEKSPEEWLKEGTSRIRSNGNVLLRLVNQMLDLATIVRKITAHSETVEVDIQGLDRGVYLVQVRADGICENRRVILTDI